MLPGIAELEGQVVVAEALGDLPAVDREHPPRRLREGDRQQVAILGKSLARAQEEGHSLPAPVVDRARRATKVSVSESAATPSSSR